MNRDGQPFNTNPYVPWNASLTGALIDPLALLAMFYRRKKGKRERAEPYFLLLCGVIMLLGVVLACQIGGTPTPTNPSPARATPSPTTSSGRAGTNRGHNYLNEASNDVSDNNADRSMIN